MRAVHGIVRHLGVDPATHLTDASLAERDRHRTPEAFRDVERPCRTSLRADARPWAHASRRPWQATHGRQVAIGKLLARPPHPERPLPQILPPCVEAVQRNQGRRRGGLVFRLGADPPKARSGTKMSNLPPAGGRSAAPRGRELEERRVRAWRPAHQTHATRPPRPGCATSACIVDPAGGTWSWASDLERAGSRHRGVQVGVIGQPKEGRPGAASRERGPLSSTRTTESVVGTRCALSVRLIDRLVWAVRRVIGRLASRRLRRRVLHLRRVPSRRA